MPWDIECDLLVAGGGLAGSALAIAMGRAGANVILVERERAFRDRIRGEVMYPWGVAEARSLGIAEPLVRRGVARETPNLLAAVGGESDEPLDARSCGPHRLGSLTFLHPQMQEALIEEAAAVATVWRGSSISAIEAAPTPTVTVETDGRPTRVRARLVVGADGRESTVARLTGRVRERDPEHLITSGMLVECGGLPADTVHAHMDPHGGRMAILLSPRSGLQRVYLIYVRDSLPRRLSGERDVDEALRHLLEIGVPEAHVAGARLRGPYASFDGAHRWIATPATDGTVLIGDAAAASDPAWGCGLSRTLRDVRLLRDALLDEDDWTAAAPTYAREHDDMFGRLRRVEHVLAELLMQPGEDADAAREASAAVFAEHEDASIELYGPEMATHHLEACLSDAGRERLDERLGGSVRR